MVNTPDCGSGMRGFDPHISPHVRNKLASRNKNASFSIILKGDNMSIYFITEKDLFDNSLLYELSSYGELHFLSSNNNQNLNDLIADEKAKIIIYDPDYAGWEFPNTILQEVPNLKAIFLGTTDKSYVNLELCKEKNIEVFNIPKYATNSVAEYLVMYMFALAKKIPLQIKNENAQEFTDAFMQMEVSNKKIGIVGLGNIGTRIAEICSCIGGTFAIGIELQRKMIGILSH